MNLTLRRSREARISGSVVDSSGRPAAFATVTLRLGQDSGSPLDSGVGQTIAKAGDFVFTNVPMGESACDDGRCHEGTADAGSRRRVAPTRAGP